VSYKIETIFSFEKNDYKKLLEVLSNSDNPKEIGISIGKNCYKIRLKNSDINFLI